jgi:hypothetical protein
MTKINRIFGYLLAGALLAISFMPLAYAHTGGMEQPITIKSVHVWTSDYLRVMGTMEVCNDHSERVSFTVNAVNTDINAVYNRKMTMRSAGCQVFKLKFDSDFSNLTKDGDTIVFALRDVKGSEIYARSEEVSTKVENTDETFSQLGGDDSYVLEEGDFLIHSPTNLRIRVSRIEKMYVELLVTNIQWGGFEKIRVFMGADKKVMVGDGTSRRVEVTNELSTRNSVTLKLES